MSQAGSFRRSSPDGNARALIDILRHDITINGRLSSIEGLIYNYLDDFDRLEYGLFTFLLNSAISLMEEILVTSFLETTKENFKENMKKCLNLLLAIEYTIDFLTKENYQLVSDCIFVPLTRLIYIVFTHCYKCKDFNQSNTSNINEVTEVFKTSCDINKKLLKFITEYFQSNTFFDNQKDVLIAVLDNMCDICEIVSELKLSVLVETWMCYLRLTTNYAQKLQTDINLVKIFGIITKFVLKHLYRIQDKDTLESEELHTLKVCKLLIKVAMKTIENCWDTCRNLTTTLFNFFTDIYSYNGKPSNQLRTYIFNKLDESVVEIITKLNISIVSLIDLQVGRNIGFIPIIYLQLSKSNISEYSFKMLQLLSNLMDCFRKEKQLFTYFSNNSAVYNGLVVRFAANILSDNRDNHNDYPATEEFLLSKIVTGSTWEAQFATDLYLLLLRHMQPTMSYKVLTHLIDEMKGYKYLPIAQFNTAKSILIFMRMLYNQLSKELQQQVLEKYSPESNYQIWYILGFKKIPASKQFLRSAICRDVEKKMGKTNLREMPHENVLNIIYAMEIISLNIDEKKDNIIVLKSCLMKLWDSDIFEYPPSNEKLLEHLFSSLKSMTEAMVKFLDSEDIMKILNQLQLSLQMGHPIKLYLSQILISTTSQRIADISLQEHGLVSTLIQALREDLSQDGANLPLRLFTLKISKNLEEIRRNLPPIENVKKNLPMDPPTKKIKIETKENIVSRRNLNVSTSGSYVGGSKKVEDDEVIDEILSRLKSDAAFLRKCAGAGKLTPQHNKDLTSIINKLQQLF